MRGPAGRGTDRGGGSPPGPAAYGRRGPARASGSPRGGRVETRNSLRWVRFPRSGGGEMGSFSTVGRRRAVGLFCTVGASSAAKGGQAPSGRTARPFGARPRFARPRVDPAARGGRAPSGRTARPCGARPPFAPPRVGRTVRSPSRFRSLAGGSGPPSPVAARHPLPGGRGVEPAARGRLALFRTMGSFRTVGLFRTVRLASFRRVRLGSFRRVRLGSFRTMGSFRTVRGSLGRADRYSSAVGAAARLARVLARADWSSSGVRVVTSAPTSRTRCLPP